MIGRKNGRAGGAGSFQGTREITETAGQGRPPRRCAWRWWGIAAGLLVAAFAGGAARAAPSDPAALFRNAAARVDLQRPNAPAFRLRAHFTLMDGGRRQQGTYQLDWVSASLFREETACGNYREVRVAANDKFWEANSAGRRPWRFRQMASALNLKSHLSVNAAGIRELDAAGLARCFAIRGDSTPVPRVCFNVAGEPVQVVHGAQTFEYADFAEWNGQSFPRSIAVVDDSQRVLELAVDELAGEESGAASGFEKPPGAEERCLNPEGPKLLDSQEPKFPGRGASVHGGTVAVYVRIGADGLIHDPVIVHTPGPEFDAPTLEALARWKFRPAACAAGAVPYDTVIEVDYGTR